MLLNTRRFVATAAVALLALGATSGVASASQQGTHREKERVAASSSHIRTFAAREKERVASSRVIAGREKERVASSRVIAGREKERVASSRVIAGREKE